MAVLNNKWNSEFYYEILSKCEDIIAEETIKWKLADDKNYYYLSAYAKAILTAKETLYLLGKGFPDGALSRAREVYERMVLASYISNNFSDDLMKRYFADLQLKASKYHKFLYNKLKNKENSKKEIYQDMEEKYQQEIDNFKQQYGKIKGDYWWTGDKNIKSFKEIQDKVEVDLLPILYKLACISTHAGALNDITLLGRDNKQGSLLRADPTKDGFRLPLLLLLESFDRLTQIVFKHFDLDIPYGNSLKNECEKLWEEVLP